MHITRSNLDLLPLGRTSISNEEIAKGDASQSEMRPGHPQPVTGQRRPMWWWSVITLNRPSAATKASIQLRRTKN